MKRSLASRLNSATVHVGRALRASADTHGLAAEQRSALSVIYFAGPIRMGALAAAERVGAPAMTRTVLILEAAGLAHRGRDPHDERAVLVSASRKGAQTVAKGRDDRVRRIAAALRVMPAESRRRLRASVGDLETLIETLEAQARGEAKAIA
ncbi:MAG: MarR family transcriptional regulator [Chloroflexi bacterium]|nr:MAG: MarR family transcriptional regulator [Chloroflexota bacterium]